MADMKDLFQYYLNNQDEFVKKYNGKYIVIKDFEVVGAFEKEADAYFDSETKYGLGNFLIQLCTPGDGAYTQYFMSRNGTVFSFQVPSTHEYDFVKQIGHLRPLPKRKKR